MSLITRSPFPFPIVPSAPSSPTPTGDLAPALSLWTLMQLWWRSKSFTVTYDLSYTATTVSNLGGIITTTTGTGTKTGACVFTNSVTTASRIVQLPYAGGDPWPAFVTDGSVSTGGGSSDGSVSANSDSRTFSEPFSPSNLLAWMIPFQDDRIGYSPFGLSSLVFKSSELYGTYCQMSDNVDFGSGFPALSGFAYGTQSAISGGTLSAATIVFRTPDSSDASIPIYNANTTGGNVSNSSSISGTVLFDFTTDLWAA